MREYNLKLDDVLNEQRRTIYTLRNRVLEANDVVAIVVNMVPSFLEREIAYTCPEDAIPEEWDVARLVETVRIVTNEQIDIVGVVEQQEVETIVQRAVETWKERVSSCPYTEEQQWALQRALLSLIDFHWTKHLEAMELLKEGIGLRYYGQEDPMRQYAKEGLELFTLMYHRLEKDASQQLAQLISQ